MDKFFTWALALFLAVVFGLLSVTSFMGWEQGANGNRIIGMMIDLQRFLVGLVGGPVTGVLFALLAVGVLWAAFIHKPQPKQG